MDKDNKQWDKLISMPNEYEADSNLADRAIAEMRKIQAQQVKKTWFQLHWKKVVACAASLILAVGIGIPVYNSINKSPEPTPPPVVYYENTDLDHTEVLDVAAFASEKGLDIGFFNVPNAKTQAGEIKETGKIALLYQKLAYVNEAGFDQIELNVVLEENLTLDFYKQYLDLGTEKIVNEAKVNYRTEIALNGKATEVLAKFTYKDADYYLDVVTLSDPAECIDTYVGMLTK